MASEKIEWPAKWAGKTWSADGGEITEAMLKSAYEALPDKSKTLRALGAALFSDRKADRAMQLLKKAGLVEYKDRTWRRVGA